MHEAMRVRDAPEATPGVGALLEAGKASLYDM
jgi:hypothetical protein